VPNILICDDDAATRFVLKRVLVRELNATVTEAADGLQAFKLLMANGYDLVILDLRMPIMNGPETLDVMRSTPALRDLPVIVLSSETEMDVITRVVSAGVTDYLLKPLSSSGTQKRLMQIIERLREGASAAAADAGAAAPVDPDGDAAPDPPSAVPSSPVPSSAVPSSPDPSSPDPPTTAS
jgi:two-component system chemotaxis response regulator CheY